MFWRNISKETKWDPDAHLFANSAESTTKAQSFDYNKTRQVRLWGFVASTIPSFDTNGKSSSIHAACNGVLVRRYLHQINAYDPTSQSTIGKGFNTISVRSLHAILWWIYRYEFHEYEGFIGWWALIYRAKTHSHWNGRVVTTLVTLELVNSSTTYHARSVSCK